MEHQSGRPDSPEDSNPSAAHDAEQVAVSAARRRAEMGARRCAERLRFMTARAGRLPAGASAPVLDELREAVESYVAALKETGRPPEKALVLVKQLLSEVAATPDEFDVLRGAAVRWTIAAYY